MKTEHISGYKSTYRSMTDKIMNMKTLDAGAKQSLLRQKEAEMHKQTLLVVDDDKSILTALRMSLENEYQVYTAKNGTEGFNLVRDKEPDLVLLDIALPDRNGIELIEQIKSVYPKIIIIMISAVEDARTIVRAIKLGAYDYLIKPAGAHELRKTLKKALEAKMRERKSNGNNE